MDVTLLYVDGYPNWKLADERLTEALARTGHPDMTVTRQEVTSPEAAERLAFRGSPTVLIDGKDPFADSAAPVGLACRLFRTPDGMAGAPTVVQLVLALASRESSELPRTCNTQFRSNPAGNVRAHPWT